MAILIYKVLYFKMVGIEKMAYCLNYPLLWEGCATPEASLVYIECHSQIQRDPVSTLTTSHKRSQDSTEHTHAGCGEL